MKKDKKDKKAKKVEATTEAKGTKKEKVNPELTKAVKDAQKRLEAYFQENKLDPTKDYSKDKKHGKKIKELVAIINVNQDKVTDAAPKEGPNRKPKGEKKGATSKYDYPLVDGKEMTADEKKKYRTKMRNASKGTEKAANKEAKKEKSEAKTEKVKAEKVKAEKKASKEEAPKAESKKDKKAKKDKGGKTGKKKVAKDED